MEQKHPRQLSPEELVRNNTDKKRYIQRDLEDQIAEELEIIKNRNMSETKPVVAPPTVDVADVIKLLESGYTRYKKDDRGQGSVQEHYNLSFSQVKELFSHEDLKGIKTKLPKLIIIDSRKTPKDATFA